MHVISESPSDHSLVCFNIPEIEYESSNKGTTTSVREIRKLSDIDINEFRNDIATQMPKAKDLASLDDAVESYNSVLLSILDKHEPKQTVIFREGKHPWWSSKCHEARRSRRAAELKYRKYRDKGSPNLAHSHQIFKKAQVDAAILLNRERNKHYREKLSSITGNAKETYKVVNKLLDKEYGTNKLPNGKSDSEIANGLKDFFHSKITNIYSDIKSADSITPIL